MNEFTEDIYGDLPVVSAREQEVFIQMSPETKRAALWGMHEAGTREAVESFIRERLLERFLDLAWRRD